MTHHKHCNLCDGHHTAETSCRDAGRTATLAQPSDATAQPRVGLTGRESIEKSIVDSVKHLTQSSGYSSLKDAQIALSYLEDVQDESGRYHLATIGSYLAGQESLANTAQGKPEHIGGLPEISDEDKAWLHYNPNTSDVIEWVENYARQSIALAAKKG